MSMRALTLLLLALSALGNAEALAVNVPAAVDPRGSEQDLFAIPPQAPVPATPVQPAPPAGVVAAPTAASAQPALIGNPLWGIPLNRLTAVRERPLFAPSRRPAPAAAPPQPVAPPPPPKPAEPATPQLSLLGTVAGDREKIGLFIDSTTKSVLRLKAGENHRGWTLRAVSPHEVELARGLDSAVLAMPSPDIKASGAPSPVSMPAMATAPTMPVNPAVPVQARAPGVTSAIPSPTPSGATIVLRPPVLEAPSAQVNPFQQSSPFPRMR